MRTFVALCALLALAHAKLDKQPNIVLMLADDLGWQDVEWHDEAIKTPHMMKMMREEGVELNQNYVQPQCTPSRAALMTGIYPFHQGMQHGVIKPTMQECIPLSLDMLPKKLKGLGYDTHHIGKWHLGYCDEACLPKARGFDTFAGFYQGFNDHFSHMFGLPGMFTGKDYRNGTDLYMPVGEHSTDVELKRALEIINFHDTEAPLFINLAFAAPHQPFVAKPEWAEMYKEYAPNEEQRGYFGMISHMDEAIGTFVEAMKAKGLHENTIYIFLSDNGGEAPIGRNGVHRSSKSSLFEGGIKSAAFVASPLVTKPGIKSEALIHVVDWYPTLISMAGGETAGLDGVDQTEALLHGGASGRQEFVVNIDSEWPWAYGKRAIRSGDFKLIHGHPGWNDGYQGDIIRTWQRCGWDKDPNWVAPVDATRGVAPAAGHHEKRAASYTPTAEEVAAENACIKASENDIRLYNVIADPSETHNLAAEHPEIVQQLMARLDEYEEDLVEIPAAGMLSKTSGLPNFNDGEWRPGFCAGVPQANDAIILHQQAKQSALEPAMD